MESPCRKRRGDIVVQGEKSMMGCHDPEAFWTRKRLCRSPETEGLVLLPPSEEGSEVPGLR